MENNFLYHAILFGQNQHGFFNRPAVTQSYATAYGWIQDNDPELLGGVIVREDRYSNGTITFTDLNRWIVPVDLDRHDETFHDYYQIIRSASGSPIVKRWSDK